MFKGGNVNKFNTDLTLDEAVKLFSEFDGDKEIVVQAVDNADKGRVMKAVIFRGHLEQVLILQEAIPNIKRVEFDAEGNVKQ